MECAREAALGRQHVRLHIVSNEAVLQGLNLNTSRNRGLLNATASLYEESRMTIVHGVSEMVRTNGLCILQHMKDVHDSWLPPGASLRDLRRRRLE